jgi:nucleotide-binding universal stress UspA family protein
LRESLGVFGVLHEAGEGYMVRIQNILCPVDFFPASERATNYAVGLAKKYGARVILLHVVEPVALWARDFEVDTNEVMRAITARSNEELRKIAKHAAAAHVPIDVVVRTGEVDLEIRSLIEMRHVDFVVMGTHGRRGLEKFFMGSTTERLLRSLNVPLLTIGSTKSKAAPSEIRQILVTTDFSDGTSDAIAYAFSIAEQYHAKVTLLHVLNDLEADLSGRYRGQLIRSIQHELENLVPAESRHSRNATVRVDTGRPIRRILPIVKSNNIDLIIMNVHGKTLLDRITIGSTAESVVRMASSPVLIVPPMTVEKRKRRTPGRAA